MFTYIIFYFDDFVHLILEIPEKDELFSSPVGAKLFVDMLMKNADTNGDGFIDSDELYRWNLQNLKYVYNI